MKLRREGGRVCRVGHRGAAAIAPENTLAAFRVAAAHGIDIVELDVVDLPGEPLVVAHSLDLAELTHGTLHGSASTRTLAELRDLVPGLVTFEEVGAFFADEGRALGLHVDLKLSTRLDELVGTIVRHGLVDRAYVTSPIAADLVAVRTHEPALTTGLTYPADRPAISRRPFLHPVITLVLHLMRWTLPFRIVRLARAAGADVVALQHRVVSRRVVARAHAARIEVVTWTVDEPHDLERVVAAGVDAVVSNDPRLLADS